MSFPPDHHDDDDDKRQGMATALSIDQIDAPASCQCPASSTDLSVHFVSVASSNTDDSSLAGPARQQEILLDLVSLHVQQCDAHFLLDDRFETFLDQPHRDLKNSILRCLDDVQLHDESSTRSTLAYHKFETFLRQEMGYKGLSAKLQSRFGTMQRSRTISGGGGEAKEAAIDSAPSASIPAVSVSTAVHKEDENNSGIQLHRAGHVFCINGSVCDLACDAFLCPVLLQPPGNDVVIGRVFSRWWRRTKQTCGTWWDGLVQAARSGVDDDAQPKTTARENQKGVVVLPLKRYPDRTSVATLRDWPWNTTTQDPQQQQQQQQPEEPHHPFLVVGQVGHHHGKTGDYYKGTQKAPPASQHLGQLTQTLREFLDVAMTELKQHQPRPANQRERYLLAVPVLGTGSGGAIDLTGQVIAKVLEILRDFAATSSSIKAKVDCVLVCADAGTYTQAQRIRYEQQDCFPCFDAMMAGTNNKLGAEAKRLIELASSGQLSLFLGAGVSVGSGLPTWFQFLHILEDQFTANGCSSERTLGDKHSWDPLAMADALNTICGSRADRKGVRIPLKKRVQQTLRRASQNPGLLLYLLLSLPTTSIVTQNYDQLIERAMHCRNLSDATREEFSVIPYQPKRGAKRWLLKMHGCVSAPNDIVLTGKDYAAFEKGRLRALAGLVQANLMTSHLLFVGFSMTDPNYLRILQEVRRALNPGLMNTDSP